MGRLSKIKRELIEESNKRLLGEHNAAQGGNPNYGHGHGNGIHIDIFAPYQNSQNVNRWQCDHPGGSMTILQRVTLNGQSVQQSDVGKMIQISIGSQAQMYMNWVGNGNICGTITGVFTHVPVDPYTDPMYNWASNQEIHATEDDCCSERRGCKDEAAINYMACCDTPLSQMGQPMECTAVIHKQSCCKYMRYRCKGPIQQATTGVSIRERANVSTTSSCVEDPNGEFETLRACQESCEAGYGPGYDPAAGTAAG